MFDGISFTITIMVPIMEHSNAKQTVDVLESLFKTTRENSYNDTGKFKRMLLVQDSIIIFHPFLQSYGKLIMI